jgi:hypothetical protein
VGVIVPDLARSRQEQWDLLREFVATYAERQPIGRIAVVGNAPLEPSAERAAAIDASDLVVRANSLVLDEPGAEPTLGTRCHVVILSHATWVTPWVFRDYRKRAYLIPQAGSPLYYKVYPAVSFWPADLGAIPIPNAVVKQRLVDVLDPEHKPGTLTPTSGMLGLFMMHEMFPDADLIATGFSLLDGGNPSAWSHHTGRRTTVNRFHDLDREGALLRSWIDEGSARFLP